MKKVVSLIIAVCLLIGTIPALAEDAPNVLVIEGVEEIGAWSYRDNTMEELVIYKSLSDGSVWARPKSMFVGKAGDVRRFKKISE